MKRLGILLAVLVCVLSAQAQMYTPYTNAPAPAPTMANANAAGAMTDTNLAVPDQIYAELTNQLANETNTPRPKVEFSLEDCIEMALKHNISLQIFRYDPQIARYALQGAYAPYDPIGFLMGEHQHSKSGPAFLGTNVIGGIISDQDSFNASVTGLTPYGTTYSLNGNTFDTVQTEPFGRTGNSGAQASATVTQPLLKNFWIDGTRLVIQVDKNRLKYSELTLKSEIMTTITQVEQAYYDLMYSRENVVVQQKAAEQTDQQLEEDKKKVQVGSIPELDLASAEAQAAQNRSAIIVAESQLGTQERLLKGLIMDDFSKWADVEIIPTGSLTAPKVIFDRQTGWKTGLEKRPDYLQAKLDAERAGIQLKYDYNQLFPEVDVFGTYGYNGSGEVFSGALYDVQQRDRPFYRFGGQISFPFANIAARNAYKSDKASMQQIVLQIKAVERNVLISIDNDIGTLQSAYDAVQSAHAQRLYEEQALDAERKKLENGKSTTYQVLLIQRDLTSARGSEIQALDIYNRDLSQLSLDEGTTLERLNIVFPIIEGWNIH